MLFIFGGDYQGMEEYAREICPNGRMISLTEQDAQIDFSHATIAGLNRFVLGCVRRGESAVKYFQNHAADWDEAILIGTDFSCGVVPMDAEMRLWREENGRLNNYLAGEAKQVVRMFCGLAQVLK